MEGIVDDARIRFLNDRVMTATPAQRVVMLFDRLALDLQRAVDSTDDIEAGSHIGHATTIVAELLGSLNRDAGGPADNLAALYGFLLKEFTTARCGSDRTRLSPLQTIVGGLRDAFAEATATLASTASMTASRTVSASASTAALGGASPAQPARAWVG
jgi:flagellar secretion chaperone FliS